MLLFVCNVPFYELVVTKIFCIVTSVKRSPSPTRYNKKSMPNFAWGSLNIDR